MKLYKVCDVVEILLNCQEIGIDGYCGFEINERGNLTITLKDHAPDWRNSNGFGEAVEEIELLENEGEY